MKNTQILLVTPIPFKQKVKKPQKSCIFDFLVFL
jgi:hypothetical protein